MKKLYAYILFGLGMLGLGLSATLPSLGYITLHTGRYMFTFFLIEVNFLQYIPAIASNIFPRKEKKS